MEIERESDGNRCEMEEKSEKGQMLSFLEVFIAWPIFSYSCLSLSGRRIIVHMLI